VLRVGLSGGIGSGKSTVAARLASLGAMLVDADEIAREVVEPGTPGLAAVVDEFGPDILTPGGTLDRPALGRLVFADDDRRRALNAIVHPLVYQRRTDLVTEAPAEAIVVEDIPLLVENGLGAGFHLVLIVHAPAEERVRRLVADRRMAADDAWARVRAQATDDERRAAADVWLDNSGPRTTLLDAVDGLWTDRLVPFEANLRAGRRAGRPPHAVLAGPDLSWPVQAERLMARVRRVAGDRAVRIEHVGSTAVPGLTAKDVIDLQVVAADLAAAAELAADVRVVGLVRLPQRMYDVGRDGREHEKAYAVNADPGRAVNLHIRPVDTPTWRDAVLLRDWLRATPTGVAEYAKLKRDLAAQPHDTIDHYAAAKTPWINDALTRADRWAERSGWAP
jgi:dephospho-CoA kinase